MFLRLTQRVLLLLINTCWVVGANAVDTDDDPANYAFSNYIGNGIYSAAKQDVTVFNIPLEYTPEQDSETSYTIRLPVSLGFYNFDFDDIGSGDLPDNMATISFVPGIEWRIPINDQLLFIPYVDLGWGKNTSTGNDVIIYSSGLSGGYLFGENHQHLWVNRIFYAGYKSLSSDVKDGFASIQSGVDWRLPWDFSIMGRSSFFSSYLLGQWYFNNLEFFQPDAQTVTVNNSVEVGVTLGLDKPIDFRLFDIDRIGIGYRYSNKVKVWRLTFNMPL
jgi:hypothetical protein